MAGRASHRSAGGYALARTGKAQAQIASEVGVSKVSAHGWVVGNYKPGKTMREKMRDLYGIPIEAWDEPYGPRGKKKLAAVVDPAPTPVPPPPDSGPIVRATSDADAAGGAFGMARALQKQAQAQLEALEAAKDWTPAEKAQVMQRLASTVNVLAKLTGQYELGRRILRLPIWKQIEFEMFEALRPFPDAARAVAERLETFEARWIGNVG